MNITLPLTKLYKIIGVTGFFASLSLILFFSNIIGLIKNFYEQFFTIIHPLGPEKLIFLKFILLLIIFILVGISSFFYFNLFIKLRQFFDKLIDTQKVLDFLLLDHISNHNNSRFIILTSLLVWPLFHIYLIVFGEPPQEGVIETYMTPLFLISSIVLIITAINVFHLRKSLIRPTRIIFVIIIMAIALILVFGEEISWGQRIFNWKSQGVFSSYNFQNETNVHNFFNPLFRFIYPVFGVSLYFSLLFLWFFPKDKSQFLNIFIPPSCFIFIVFLLGATSFRGHSEIFEELLAIFILLYSIRLFMSFRMNNTKLIKSEF